MNIRLKKNRYSASMYLLNMVTLFFFNSKSYSKIAVIVTYTDLLPHLDR